MFVNKTGRVLFALLAMSLFAVHVQAANHVARAVAAAATWAPEPQEFGECNDTMPFKDEFLASWTPDWILDIYSLFRNNKNFEAGKERFLLYPLTDHFTTIVPESVKCNVEQECEVS